MIYNNEGFTIKLKDVIYFFIFIGIFYYVSKTNHKLDELNEQVGGLTLWNYVKLNQVLREIKKDSLEKEEIDKYWNKVDSLKKW